MALVRNFEHKLPGRITRHGEIEAKYSVLEHIGEKLIQINGSSSRKQPGKQSQTLQLDSVGAEKLYSILKHEFGFR